MKCPIDLQHLPFPNEHNYNESSVAQVIKVKEIKCQSKLAIVGS